MARFALAQIDCRLGDVAVNTERITAALAEAVARGADVVVFPELALSGYSIGEVDEDLSLAPHDPRLLHLAQCAGRAGLALGFVESGRGLHTYNSVAYFENGRPVHVHRKLYLPTYAVFEERKHFTPGQSLRAFDTSLGHRAAVLLCNDAWQPQLAFLAAQDSAEVLFIPADSAQSSVPERYDSQSYWRGITRFYGRMLQTFVVFVNRVGTEGPLAFWGGSHVVDPWGEVIAEAPAHTEHLLVADVNLGDVRRRRREIPLVKEARLGLIRREVDRLLDEGGDL
jgi:predicted amidohydrolase